MALKDRSVVARAGRAVRYEHEIDVVVPKSAHNVVATIGNKLDLLVAYFDDVDLVPHAADAIMGGFRRGTRGDAN